MTPEIADTTDEACENTETADVEVYYTRGGHQRDAENLERGDRALEVARDMRTFADPEDLTAETFDIAYAKVAEGEVSLDDVVDTDNVTAVLGHIYSRLQGGRVDEELGYDGSETRSAMIGDVIVVDGRAALVGEGASFPDLGEFQYLTNDADDEEAKRSETTTYRKRDSAALVHDVRELLTELDTVEVWSDHERKLATVTDSMAIWEIEGGDRGAIISGDGPKDHVLPEDVVELVVYDADDEEGN